MFKYNLVSKIRRKIYRHYTDKIYKCSNIINRGFEEEVKNKKWITDVGYIPAREGTLYLSIIRVLLDNSIVLYKTANKLVFDVIRDALDNDNPNDLILHNYGAYLYVSQKYHDIAKVNNIELSISRVGNPYDNLPRRIFWYYYDNSLTKIFFSIIMTVRQQRIF